MNRATKLLDHTMIVLAVTFGVGSVGLLAATDSLTFIRLNFSEAGVLFWDTALSFAFFLQHSGMVRRPFRARLATVIAPRYQGAVYAIASGIVLTLVVVLWQRSQTHLLVLHGVSALDSSGLFVPGDHDFRLECTGAPIIRSPRPWSDQGAPWRTPGATVVAL